MTAWRDSSGSWYCAVSGSKDASIREALEAGAMNPENSSVMFGYLTDYIGLTVGSAVWPNP